MGCASSQPQTKTPSTEPAAKPSKADPVAPVQPVGESMKTYKYIFLGGGASAGYAAREMVKRGLQPGELAILTAEAAVSYERPALSKGFLNPTGGARLPGFHTCVGEGGERQTLEWYVEKGIDYKTNFTVTAVDFAAKTLTSASGEKLGYSEALILATGARAITLADFKVPGGDLGGVHALRDVADGLKLVEDLEKLKAAKGTDANVVIIGGGYIGLEASAGLSQWGFKTTVLFPEPRLMARVFDEKIGAVYSDFYKSKEIALEPNAKVVALKSADGASVSSVETADGRSFPADLVLCGLGARANIELFSGLELEAGGVKVDGNMRTNIPGVYAVGDIAAFPLKFDGGKLVRQEHVTHARRSAEHAVASILDPSTPGYDYLPFFYSREFAFSWKLWGLQRGETVHFGELEVGKAFGAFFVEEGKIVGAFLESGSDDDSALLKTLVSKKAQVAEAAKLGGVEGLQHARSLL